VKRSVELAILSREHHLALELALRLKRASSEQADRLAAQAGEFWRKESMQHFRLEEEFLLPRLARRSGSEDPDIARTLNDHAALRQRFASVDLGESGVEALRQLGQLLTDHVRFEERVLFPRMESTLGPDELAAVRRELESASRDRD
jgi:hemerythrin-like domain-containing protein